MLWLQKLDLQAEVLSCGSAVSTGFLSALHFEQLKSMEFIEIEGLKISGIVTVM